MRSALSVAGMIVAMLLCAGCATTADGGRRPPKPFVSDGCSLFPDGNYRTCCERHDLDYWCGGTVAQRRAADRDLQQCVAERGHPARSRLMFAGVRVGGVPWLPLPWRWGFGWPYGRGYTAPPALPCELP